MSLNPYETPKGLSAPLQPKFGWLKLVVRVSLALTICGVGILLAGETLGIYGGHFAAATGEDEYSFRRISTLLIFSGIALGASSAVICAVVHKIDYDLTKR